jgi:NAD(P)-dependent dehydrogenase (short-subunit alcohol dehydrogenase family)
VAGSGLGTALHVMTENTVALVTGASSGIGREVSHLLAARGADVVLLARGVDGLESVAAECIAKGARSVDVVPCDVGDHAAVTEAVDRVVDRHGGLDAVVNAAGVFATGATTDIPADVFDAVVRTNLLGSSNVARAALPVFRRQERGTLVLFGSLLGHVTAPSIAPYVVSKWGVRALARVLEAEVRETKGVRVEYVAPAGVDTPIYRRAANYLGRELKAPPPLTAPRVVAEDVLALLDGRSPSHVNAPLPRLFHAAARVGFGVLPGRLYDALSSVAIDHVATEPEPAPETSGAVLGPVGSSVS